MIYFTRSGDAVKIGYATRPDQRIQTFRTGNPNQIVVLGVMDGDKALERQLHKHFAEHHIRGEWFVLCDEIVDYIEAHCRPCLFGIKRIGVMPPESSDPAKDKPFLWLMFTATVPALLYTSGRVALLHDLFDPASTFGSLALDVVALSGIALVSLMAALYTRLLWLIVRNCLADYRYRKLVNAYAR